MLDDSREHLMDATSAVDLVVARVVESAVDLVVLRVVESAVYWVAWWDEKKGDLARKMVVVRVVLLDQK